MIPFDGLADRAGVAGSRGSAAPDAAPAESKLATLLAGAHARGIADCLEMLGFSAALVDDCGKVLDLSVGAEAFLGGEVGLVAGHFVGADADANQRLQSLISAAVGGHGRRSHRFEGPDGAGFVIAILALPEALRTAGQIMRAALLFEAAPAG